MTRYDHPMFTRLYRAISSLGEHTHVAEVRGEVLSHARGRLLIIGLGPGHDLDHVPPAVTSVVAVEPSESMREASLGRVAATRERGVPVSLLDGVGEALPLADASVDSILVAYVLCTVADVALTLSEMRRVLRPGGTVCVLEHVRAKDPSPTALLQRAVSVAGMWSRITGGCECRRDTRAALVSAGYDVGGLAERSIVNAPVVSWTLLGPATPVAG